MTTAIQRRSLAGMLALGMLLLFTAFAAEGASPKEPSVADGLAVRQERVAGRFARLEQLMLKMAEVDASSNPRRAALLRQAVQQSKRNGVSLRFENVVKLLEQQRLKPALDGQGQVQEELQQLLDLLLTENRSDRLQTERARIKEYIKELRRIGRVQKGLIGRTEGGDDAQRLAREQKRAAERADKLADRIAEDTPASENKSDSKNGDSQEDPESGDAQKSEPEDGKSGDGKKKPQGEPGDKNKKGEKKSNGEEKNKEPGESSPAPSSDPKDSQGDKQNKKGGSKQNPPPGKQEPSPNGGKPQNKKGQPQNGEGSPGESSKQSPDQSQQPSPDEPPAKKRIEAAEKKMREAQHKLEDAKRREAIDEQREAKRLIDEAIAELEEILRQMREEEVERTLAMLEGRFRKMLEMELRVYESTLRLAKISVDRRGREVDIQSGKLSFEQRRISVEADKALLLLREEGSSIAFPETVEQMREDMEQVTDLLANTRIGRLTQSIEEDVISALEEIIEALNIAQKEQKERQQQQQQQQQGKPGDQPLVDAIAELKMVRALQMRVNRRTKNYAVLLDKEDDPVGQAKDELRDSIRRLSDREQRIQKITSDIVLGKNK